jgi:hypothetical protein
MAVLQRLVTSCDRHDEGYHGEDDPITTVEFALNGDELAIDLCDPEASKLRELFEPYIAVARKVVAPTPAAPTKKRGDAAAKAREKREFYALVRDWAKDQQDLPPVSPRGRISAEVIAAYERAHRPAAPQADQQADQTPQLDHQQPEHQAAEHQHQAEHQAAEPAIPPQRHTEHQHAEHTQQAETDPARVVVFSG